MLQKPIQFVKRLNRSWKILICTIAIIVAGLVVLRNLPPSIYYAEEIRDVEKIAKHIEEFRQVHGRYPSEAEWEKLPAPDVNEYHAECKL